MPKQQIEKNEYSLPKWSFLRFLLVNWKIWITLGIIVYGFFFIGKALHEDKFFSETIISDEYKDLKIIQKRSNPNTSILTSNPYDPLRFYEIDLGLGCILKPDLLGKSFNLRVNLIQRNYNNTYYLKFPTIKDAICERKNKTSDVEKDIDKDAQQNPDVQSNNQEKDSESTIKEALENTFNQPKIEAKDLSSE